MNFNPKEHGYLPQTFSEAIENQFKSMKEKAKEKGMEEPELTDDTLIFFLEMKPTRKKATENIDPYDQFPEIELEVTSVPMYVWKSEDWQRLRGCWQSGDRTSFMPFVFRKSIPELAKEIVDGQE